MFDKASQIHEKVITIDTYNDINVKNFTNSINYMQLLETQVNLSKMEIAGLDLSWLIIHTGQDSLTSNDYLKALENAMEKFEAIHRLCKQIAPEEIGLSLTSDDVRSISSGAICLHRR